MIFVVVVKFAKNDYWKFRLNKFFVILFDYQIYIYIYIYFNSIQFNAICRYLYRSNIKICEINIIYI